VTLFAGESRPRDALIRIADVLGAFPPFGQFAQGDKWTTKALTDFLWKDGVPAFSLLWLGDPDLTQHQTAPGAQPALAAIKSCDENLAAVLSALDRQGARKTTDVFVVSDHGFSAIERSIDLRKILNDAGFTAKTEFSDEPKPGDIMLVGNGGSVLFYIVQHDAAVTRRLVACLQQSDFSGVIFTTEPRHATFGLAPPQKLDGRVLSEALVKVDPATAGLKPEIKTIEVIKDFPAGTWRQSLQISRVGSTEYLDEGNGAFVPEKHSN